MCWPPSKLLRGGTLEVLRHPNVRTAFARLLRGRGHDFQDATAGLTSYRSDLVRLPGNFRYCALINGVMHTEACVPLEEYHERMLRDPLELEGSKLANAHTDPCAALRRTETPANSRWKLLTMVAATLCRSQNGRRRISLSKYPLRCTHVDACCRSASLCLSLCLAQRVDKRMSTVSRCCELPRQHGNMTSQRLVSDLCTSTTLVSSVADGRTSSRHKPSDEFAKCGLRLHEAEVTQGALDVLGVAFDFNR